MPASSFSARRLTALALLTAAALAIYLLEASLPPPLPVPGVKLGLANVITLVLLLCTTPRDAFIVLLLRILLGSLLGGQVISFWYSLTGGLFCFIVMWLMGHFLKGHYPVLISISGALAHNAAQLLTAVWITSTPGLWSYVPVLILSAAAAGAFTGLCAQFSCPFLKHYLKSSGNSSEHL